MAKNERDFVHKLGSENPAPRSPNLCPLKSELVDQIYAELDNDMERPCGVDETMYNRKKKPKKRSTKKKKPKG